MSHSVTLPLLLKQLHLNTMQEQWKEVAERAGESHWTYPQYLTILCNQEVANRDQKKIQRLISDAKLPIGKTLDTFKFTGLKSVNSAQISAFAESTDWINHTRNLLLFGPSGVGKTHLAAAIGRSLAMQGVKVLFAKTTTLTQILQVEHKKNMLCDYIAKLSKFQLLILDDIGYVKKSDSETSVLFELIADRYETGSMLITSNQSFDKWDTIFPNNIMAVAAIDRLVHHATIININEPSYRTANKTIQPSQHDIEKKSGELGEAAKPAVEATSEIKTKSSKNKKNPYV
jgi:DNA replication protein DnaC